MKKTKEAGARIVEGSMTKSKEPTELLGRVLELLAGVRPSGAGFTALCPAHADTNPSLSIAQGKDGRVLMKCFAGCQVDEIADALGLELRDLFAASVNERPRETGDRIDPISKDDIEAVYPYLDERGRLLYQVVRSKGKRFRPRQPGENDRGTYSLTGVRRVLYNLPDVISASHVIFVEGEKDADRVKKALPRFKDWKSVRAWAVTTCSGGTSGWRQEFAPFFAGKAVYILPDNDDPGRKFAENVAKAIAVYARVVKIIPLPDLPEKGDVSDFLQVNSALDLQEELRQAPAFEPTTGNAQDEGSSSFWVKPLRNMFDEPEEKQSWLVDDLLPTGGMSLLAGKPKAGKSTLARQLSLCVATGSRFLGRPTGQGAVLYLALEEKRVELTRHFRDLGATGDEDIRIHCAPAPIEAMEQARILLKQNPASLLIVDPLFKFTRVRDGNDYAMMTAALEPILTMSRETGTHIMLVHHSGKAERDDPADAILGSTALLGNVDTAILLNRREEYRTILTRQRYGDDIEESVLEFDPDRRLMSLGATRQQAESDKLGNDILDFLRANPKSVESEILESVVGRRQRKIAALRALVGTEVVREGKGGRKDPYRYSAGGNMGTRTDKMPEKPTKTREVVVPERIRDSGNKNRKQESRPSGSSKNPVRKANGEGDWPPWSEFQERVAILEVEGGLPRAEAERSVRASMRKRSVN